MANDSVPGIFTCLILAPSTSLESIIAILDQNVDLYKFETGYTRRFITLNTEVQYGSLVSEAAQQIPRTIETSDAIIADLTDANPNIMYEVGLAHGLKKPLFPIVATGGGSIPSDLSGYLFCVYDISHTRGQRELSIQIFRWIRRIMASRTQLVT
jgi:hypothetical protein